MTIRALKITSRMSLLGLLCLTVGCATPDYMLPGGYSSTYHKAISGVSETPSVPNTVIPATRQQRSGR